ncbi:MAG: DinB family protein [Dehalococcoidia bacterium]
MLLPERDPQGWAAKALREAGNSFLAEIRGMDDVSISFRPTEDEMSVKELVAHVRDAGALALDQIKALLNWPDKPLPVRDIDLLVMERDYRSADLMAVLLEFRDTRQELTGLLWALSSREWDQVARHPYRGDITITTIAGELARHDLEHLWHVRKIKGSLPQKVHVSDEWDQFQL